MSGAEVLQEHKDRAEELFADGFEVDDLAQLLADQDEELSDAYSDT